MRNRALPVSFALLAVLLWIALLTFMNRRAPDTANELVFLGILCFAVACTVMPVAYLINARLAGPLAVYYATGRAFRQGLLAGVLAALLMALRFMRMLNLIMALILVLVVILVETLLQLRER